MQIPSKFIQWLFFTLENNVEEKKLKSNERLKDTVLTRNLLAKITNNTFAKINLNTFKRLPTRIRLIQSSHLIVEKFMFPLSRSDKVCLNGDAICLVSQCAMQRRWKQLTHTYTYTPFHPSLTPTFGTAKGGAYNPGYIDMKKFLKNLLRNCRSDFEIISQECSLGHPFQKLFVKFWSIHKHGSGEWGLLAL